VARGAAPAWDDLDVSLSAEEELEPLRFPEGATTATLVNRFTREVSTVQLDGGEVFAREHARRGSAGARAGAGVERP
jgi:hypothetical protein